MNSTSQADSNSDDSGFYRSRSQSSPSLMHQMRSEPYDVRPIHWKSFQGSRTPPPSQKPEKLCGVCGDRAKSYHFGGISCDSCKAFFRRSVQNEAYKNFQCLYEGRCDITVSSRKCCQYCRFQKCSSIGMEKSWVMTEDERNQMLKNRLERRQRLLGGGPPINTSVSGKKSPFSFPRPNGNLLKPSSLEAPTKYLNYDDILDIEELMNAFYRSCSEIPVPNRTSNNTLERTELFDIFFNTIKQMSLFAQNLQLFSKHSQTDREILLRNSVLEMCIIRGVLSFDEKHLAWMHPQHRSHRLVSLEDCRRCLSSSLVDSHLAFITSMKVILEDDEPTVMLLAAIALNSPDRPGLERPSTVALLQERYCSVLRNYLCWRYGYESGTSRYPKLLLGLPNLRELADAHQDLDLKLEDHEAKLIHTKLGMLHVQESQTSETKNCITPMTKQWSLESLKPTAVSPLCSPDDSTSSENSTYTFQNDVSSAGTNGHSTAMFQYQVPLAGDSGTSSSSGTFARESMEDFEQCVTTSSAASGDASHHVRDVEFTQL